MSLIESLIDDGYLRSTRIIDAFKKIKRRDFVLPEYEASADLDVPLQIGRGQTISQPATVAFMLELLAPEEGDKVLDIGSGSGWTTALLSDIVGKDGKVFGIELIDELRRFGEANVSKYGFIKRGIAVLMTGDGYRGLPEQASFDRILVSAAAETFPDKLLRQLKVGGRLVVPIGAKSGPQEIVVMEQLKEGEYSEERYPGFVFVPLIKK